MLFSAALVLSAFASAAAASIRVRPRDPELYAWAPVDSPKNGIHINFEFFGTKDPDGGPTYVKISNVKGLTDDPNLGGPFLYHLHTNPVPDDGNCTKTLAHLDPLNVTEGFTCDPAFPQYCQTGDLSGKHGKLNGTSDGKIDTFGYHDGYVRFFPKTHSLLGRSIVVHSSNKTRLACGNVLSTLDGTGDYSFKPTNKASDYVTDYPTAAPVQPSPPVLPTKDGQLADPASLPYPLPMPAYSLGEALNIKLTTITHSVKYAGSEHTITQPKEEKVDGTGPF